MDENGHVAGQHYSGRNRVPNIQEFMAQLDTQKKERDAAIDSQLKKNKAAGEIQPHQNEKSPSKKDTRTVRDPVTGKDVEIRDNDMDFEEATERPQVRSLAPRQPWFAH